nr:NAC domain-containing protein [Tanacetum cinerariifolium]
MTNLHSILLINNNSLTVVRSVEVPIIALIVKLGTNLSMSLLLESELILVSFDLECSVPINLPPLPCTDVLGDAIVDIDLPLEEQLDTLSTRDREIDLNPSRDIKELERLLADDQVPRVFNETLGHSNSVSRSFDVTFSNSLFDFNDDYTLCYDNPLFDKEFEDISSLDPLELTPVIDESTMIVTPPPDSKQINLKVVERFDPFFSLTQLGGKTRVMKTPSFEIPSDESKVHIEVLLVLWGNRLPVPDGSLPLSR